MTVHVVADDPVREEVAAALGDVDVEAVDASVDEIEGAVLAVVADVVGSARFQEANRRAIDGGTRWLAVEVGGVGATPFEDVDAAVSVFGPDTACYDCLRARIDSTREGDAATGAPRGDRGTVRLAGAIAGRECVRLLADDASSLLGGVLELPYVRREVFPVEGCSCQPGTRDRSIEITSDESRTIEETVDRMNRAVDERVGLVRAIGESESYPAPYYLATLADTAVYSDATAPKNAAGVDEDWNRAFVKGIGEALERYCASVYRGSEFTDTSAAALDSALEPTAIVRPDDAAAYETETTIPWVEGVNLHTDGTTFLPADAVHFPQPGTGVVAQITTGLGLGSTMADAIVSGLTEVIERDATMLSWYSTYEPLELVVEDDGFDRLARRVGAEGLEVTPLLVTQDVDVPVVAVCAHRDGTDPSWPAFAAGAAADLDVDAAARSALAEATQNWMELRSIGPEGAADAGGWIGHYASFPEPVRSFVDVDGAVDAATLRPESVPTGVPAVRELLDRIEAAEMTAYAARVTIRDVASLGFEAVRVVVPTAQPLFTNEPFFGERVHTVPESLGYESRIDREPHPYP